MKAGDKVVCVDDGPCRWCGRQVTLLKGAVYVIEIAKQCPVDIGVKLIGNCGCVSGCGFFPQSYTNLRFRPLAELKAENALKAAKKGAVTA